MMKRILPAMFALLGCLSAAAGAQPPTATEIVQRANDILNQDTAFARMKMTIVTTSGATRDLWFDSWMKDHGQKNLIRYTAPGRVKDQALLLLNNADDLWSYFPRTGRVRKLATHAKKQKMQGSDFSYEDMGSGDSFLKDFDHRLLGEETVDGHPCWRVELARKPDADSKYARIIVWIDQKTYVMWRLDYYDEDDPQQPAKRLLMSDLDVVDGVPTPLKMVMHNLQDDTETTQEILEISYHQPIDDAMFTERGLSR